MGDYLWLKPGRDRLVAVNLPLEVQPKGSMLAKRLDPRSVQISAGRSEVALGALPVLTDSLAWFDSEADLAERMGERMEELAHTWTPISKRNGSGV
ncbi:hypothetical protein LRG07_10175 [Halorhodospira sp. 9622]|nr:hypothetical protein [Halorhodospira sp. 9622]